MDRSLDPTYSNDVEIDHDGRVVAARDIPSGELIEMPMHIYRKIEMNKPNILPPHIHNEWDWRK